jgi:hypothetical protein
MTLFERYLMVDWSSASKPTGVRAKDSIWIAMLDRRHSSLKIANYRTRHMAMEAIRRTLQASAASGQRTVAGFDFSFGYPSGLAAKLRLSGRPWLALWRELARIIEDAPNNANNRFAVAAALNRRLGNEPFPFWGCPSNHACATLVARGRRPHGPADLAERRSADIVVRGAQPIWKLHYPGSVGGQTLVGISRLHALRFNRTLAPVTRIWPFETGLRSLRRRELTSIKVLLTEIYPSLLPLPPGKGIKDARQVETMVRFLAAHDRAGTLGPLFGSRRTRVRRAAIESEEGWIFAAGTRIVGAPRPRLCSPSRGEGARRRAAARPPNPLPGGEREKAVR